MAPSSPAPPGSTMDTTTIDPIILAALRTQDGVVGHAARHAVYVAHQRAVAPRPEGLAETSRYERLLRDAESSARSASHHIDGMLDALRDSNTSDAAFECTDAIRMLMQAHTTMMRARGFLDGIETVIVDEHRRHLESES